MLVIQEQTSKDLALLVANLIDKYELTADGFEKVAELTFLSLVAKICLACSIICSAVIASCAK